MFGCKPFTLTYLLITVLSLSACGGKSSSSDNEKPVDPPLDKNEKPVDPPIDKTETLSFRLNNNVYAAIRFDNGEWQSLIKDESATYIDTPEVATVLSICGDNILLQQRTFTSWVSSPSINPECPATNPEAPRQVAFEFPAGSILYDMAISPAGASTDPADNQRIFTVTGSSLSYTAVFEVSDQLYYLHEKDIDVSAASSFSLTTENATPISWSDDVYDNIELPLGGYEPFYIEDGVKFSLTPFTDEWRYNLSAELTQNGYIEHGWYSVNTDQIRFMTSDNFKVTFPGLINTNSLSNTVSISQDGKTLQLTKPQQIEQSPLPLSKMVAHGTFAGGSVHFEVDGDTCSEDSCTLTFESPMQLPGFEADLASEAAKFDGLSNDAVLRWYAQYIKTTDSETDTVLVSESSLLPLF
jgi:hypothetical protein